MPARFPRTFSVPSRIGMRGRWLGSSLIGGVASGGASAITGAAALLADETDGIAFDFISTDAAKQVAVKVAGVVTEYEAGSFLTNSGTPSTILIDAVSGLECRSTDRIKFLTSALSFFSTTEGTVYVKCRTDNGNGENPWALRPEGSNQTFIDAVYTSGSPRMAVYSANVEQAVSATGDDISTFWNHFTVGWKTNDFACSTDGGAVVTDTSGSIPAGLTDFCIGHGHANPMVGYIEKLVYVPRKVANADIPGWQWERDTPTLSGSAVTVVADGAHNAFPGLTKLADGTLVAVYRSGGGHVSADGVIKQKISTDSGATWGSATTIISTQDARDPEITTLANGNVLLSYFLLVEGEYSVWVKSGTVSGSTITWGASAEVVVSELSPVACSSKPIELASGRILLPIYGNEGANTGQSAAVAISDDGGATWSDVVITAQGSSTGVADFNESNGVQLSTGRIVMFVRDEVNIYSTMYSDDDGETWSAPADAPGLQVFTASPGRPSPVLYGNDKIFLIMRKTGGTSTAGYLATYYEGTLDFTKVIEYALPPSRGMFVYASPILLSPGIVGAIIAAESSDISDIVFQRFAVV